MLQTNLMDSNRLEALLKGCMKAKALKPGKQVHAHVLATATTHSETNKSLNSTLLTVYACCGDMKSARKLFETLQKPTCFGWNWMISASAFRGDCETAFSYFSQMQGRAYPNKFTFSCALKACVGLMDVNKGNLLHGMLIKMGFENEVSVANALIDMYCKCGSLEFARKLFDEMPERDVASWTCMICGYLKRREFEQSLLLFEQMRAKGLEPNEFTWNAMIAGYAQSGDCHGAFKIFSRMINEGLTPDLVTWNAMIAGFSQNHQYFEAIALFREVLASGLQPNSVTIAGLLPAYGYSGSLHRGKQVHALIYRRGLNNVFTGTGLIDMYSKCGSVKDAWLVFEQTMEKNVASWNAMIGCYGKHGLVERSIQLFERMRMEGIEASQVTFTSILSACSHAGLVDKGLEIFFFMKESGFELCREHYACMVDLLCRSGRLMEAYTMVKEMPMEVNDSIIGSFFTGCRIHEKSDIAKMAEKILVMELKRPGGYVTLSNIYAANGQWGWVESVRKVMKEKGVYKKAGISWVEKKEGLVALS